MNHIFTLNDESQIREERRINTMKKTLIVGLILFAGCAGGNYSSQKDNFDMSICNKIPLSVEEYQAMDPKDKANKISCADLERCASISGQTPPNIPCE